MAKRVGITLIVIALTIVIAYTVVGITTFKECDVITTTPTTIVKGEYKAELIYNSLSYNSGAYEYGVQANVNIAKIVNGATVVEKVAREQQAKDAIASIKAEFESRGYKITVSEEYFVSAIIATYASYEELALSNGETGYDLPTKSTNKTYNNWLFNKTVSERVTVFKEVEGTTLEFAERALNGIDGVYEGDVSFVFNYGTPYKTSTIASDADAIYKLTDKETGLFSVIHEFRLNSGNRGRIITLVQTTPNTYTWYLGVVAVSLLVAGIVTLAVAGKRSK